MKLNKLLASNYKESYKIGKGLELLGFKEDLALETKSFIMSQIMDYLFKNSQSISKGQKVFDLELDYKYYYCDFYSLGIDLNKDYVSWWKFDALLDGLFLKKDSVIMQIINYRSYKKPTSNAKIFEAEEHKFYLQKQRQYALPQTEETIDENMQKLWNYVEKKAGENNE